MATKFKRGLPKWWEFTPPLVPFLGMVVIDTLNNPGTDWGTFGYFIGVMSASLWIVWLAHRGYFDREE